MDEWAVLQHRPRMDARYADVGEGGGTNWPLLHMNFFAAASDGHQTQGDARDGLYGMWTHLTSENQEKAG